MLSEKIILPAIRKNRKIFVSKNKNSYWKKTKILYTMQDFIFKKFL